MMGGKGVWIVGGASNEETTKRRHNTLCEASQERVFILCCDKVKVEHLEKHISWGGVMWTELKRKRRTQVVRTGCPRNVGGVVLPSAALRCFNSRGCINKPERL